MRIFSGMFERVDEPKLESLSLNEKIGFYDAYLYLAWHRRKGIKEFRKLCNRSVLDVTWVAIRSVMTWEKSPYQSLKS